MIESARLRTMLAAVSDGPWHTSPTDDTCILDASREVVAFVPGDYATFYEVMEADAVLIALAPSLAEEVIRLRAALEQAHKLLAINNTYKGPFA